jgi:hypothetical protein
MIFQLAMRGFGAGYCVGAGGCGAVAAVVAPRPGEGGAGVCAGAAGAGVSAAV